MIKSFPKAILLLEDGTHFEGVAAGKIGTTSGEICYNTGMTGYQEIFTDPSYFGQIVVNTNVHIGNYGTKADEQQSDSVKIKGLVCRAFNEIFSRKTADSSLQDYFIKMNITSIAEVDTRQIVQHIRKKGAMNGIISSETDDIQYLSSLLKDIPTMGGMELSSYVSTPVPYIYGSDDGNIKIAVLDLGVKKNILENFKIRGSHVKVFNPKTTFQEMQKFNPDGYFISNGPGDPAPMQYAIDTVQEILKHNKPLFGICLGHQILSLAIGAKTYKMHNGHRGLNHPVHNLISGKSEITSQNHGFAVDKNSLNQEIAEITHINLNDDTLEGIRLKNGNAFSVQYHPEASPGPNDANYLFDEFMTLIKNK